MAIALDTNIFVYAHCDGFSQHASARNFLSDFLNQGEPFYLSWQVYYEYLRVMTHSRILKHALTLSEAAETMKPYLHSPQCQMLTESTEHHSIFLELTKKFSSAKGNFIHDCHYATILFEHGIHSIATADTDFMKFDFLKVINPCV